MRLTPLDIKKQDFKRVMRGVDADEVQSFLQMVGDQWQELVDENSRLDRRIIELESKLTHYQQVEEAMQEALKTARQSSKQALDSAKSKAKAIVEEAVSAASRIQKQAEDEKYSLRRDIDRIRSRRAEVIARLRALLNSEIAILEDHENQYPVVRDTDVVDELEASGRESNEPNSGDQEALAAMEQLEESVDVSEDDSILEDAAVEAEEVSAAHHADEDTLSFETSDDPAVNHVGGAVQANSKSPSQSPAAGEQQEQARHSSPEMDKIRKILDDLA